MRIIEKKKCRTFSDAGKIVSNIESDLCFYYHCLNSAGSMDHYLPLSKVPMILVWYLPHNSFTHSVYWETEWGKQSWGKGTRLPVIVEQYRAWSAGHCSKLRMNHDQRKNLWCEVLHQRGHYKSDIGQFGVSKNMRLHSKTWTHQFIPWV